MFKRIVSALKKNLPRPFYNLIRLPYSILFKNTKRAFGPIGFLQKTKLDLYEVLGKTPKFINYREFKFYSPGWEMLLERNGYHRLNNLQNILDLGGYVGDSAIELVGYNNKKIHVFEPEKEKFKWMAENIKLNNLQSKIVSYNCAVVSGQQKSLEIKKNGNFCGASSIERDPSLKEREVVDCINIKKVMELAEFDGLKCDIEGGEFEIIKYFLENPKDFTFKKGVLEWHFMEKDDEKKKILVDFLNFLKENKYKFYFYPQNKPKQIVGAKEELKKIFKNPAPKYPYTNMFYFYKD